jgi:hypothetical protein
MNYVVVVLLLNCCSHVALNVVACSKLSKHLSICNKYVTLM